ncbi:MAG: hypothetical protein HY820_35380 [Acidobacteria bacterium]|nr:hypothetical protein [Acidobacteriota bacterium]
MSRLSFLLLFAAAVALGASERGGRVVYIGGTVDAIRTGTSAFLRTGDQDYLMVAMDKSLMKVLYERVNLLEYGQQASRRLALAVLVSPVFAMSKKRRHFLTVGFTDDEGRQNAMVFVVDKNDIRTVLATLEARTGRKVEFQDEEARRAGRG